MANLHQKDAFTNRSLIVTVHKELADNKGAYLIAQIDQSLKDADKVASGESKADTNPYLNSVDKTFTPKDGGEAVSYTDHTQYYSKGQLDAMRAAAKSTEIDGKEVLGLTANLMRNAKGQILINTKGYMSATKNPHFGKTVLDKQEAVTASAKLHKAETLAAQKEAKEAEVVVEAEAAEPEPEA